VTILRLSLALLLNQIGFHAYTATLPLALSRAGHADATIGLVMGVAAIVQIPAAIAGGRLLDRFGPARLFTTGGLAFISASAILLLPGVDVSGSLEPFVFVRMLQGAGVALCLPAALSMVPRLVAAARVPHNLSVVGAAQNLTLVLAPPLAIAILDATSLDGVAATVVVVVVIGIVLGQRMPLRPRVPAAASHLGEASRRFGITYRREWTYPLLIIVTYVAHWGAVTTYLPIKADQSGANIGLFFAFDGLSIFLMRIPSGWLVERIESRALILVGAAMTFVSIGILLLPITTPLLIVSGLIGGAGGAIVITPITVEMSRRSTDADRGSAFSLFSGAIAAAITLGSIGGAPLVAVFGLSAALVAGLVLIVVAMLLTLADRSLAGVHRPPPPRAPAPAAGAA
jgi:MFS family permease